MDAQQEMLRQAQRQTDLLEKIRSDQVLLVLAAIVCAVLLAIGVFGG